MLSLPLTLPELDAVIKLAFVGLRQQPDETLIALAPVIGKLRQSHIELSRDTQPEPGQ